MTRLIDADYVKEHMRASELNGRRLHTMELEERLAVIDEVPTVDAVPVRHGKWKKIRGAINCSACKSSSWSMFFEDLVTSFNYCPNCGARMDEE